MFYSTSHRHMIWKEWRQLQPLILALPLLSLLLMAITKLTEPQQGTAPEAWLMLILLPPMLYAVAVGAVVVGQERDSKTLTWLTSLPLSARQLFTDKVGVGLAGLTLMWLASLSLTAIWYWWYERRVANYVDPTTQVLLTMSVLYSLYFFVCSYASSWVFRSLLGSILVLIPLGFLPAFVADVVNGELFRNGGPIRSYSLHPSLTIQFWSVLGSMVGMGLIAYAVAMRRLGPVRSHFSKPTSMIANSFASVWDAGPAWLERLRGDSQTWSPPRSAVGSLLWQFRTQHFVLLTSILIVLVGCFRGVANVINPHSSDDYLLVSIVAFPAIGWLGTLVFHGDRTNQRIRFLAERGVSPSQVWLTRHLIPCLMVVVIVIWLGSLHFQGNYFVFAKVTFAQAMLTPLIVYAISQWTAQVVRSFSLAVVGAPVMASIAVMWANYLDAEREYPLWLTVIALVLLPMVATWVGTRRWMECRTGFRFWRDHAVVLGISLALTMMAISPWWLPVAGRARTLDPRLLAEADAIPTAVASSVVLPAVIDSMKPPSLVTRSELIEQQVKSGDGHIRISNFDDVVAMAAMQRLRLDAGSLLGDQASIDHAKTQYERWVGLLVDIVVGLRQDTLLASQEQSDMIEIWLLAELAKPGTVSRLDDELLVKMIMQLGNSDKRWQSRRRALLASWSDWYSEVDRATSNQSFGGYVVQVSTDQQTARKRMLDLQRHIDAMVQTIVRSIDNQSITPQTLPVSNLIAVFDRSEMEYGIGTDANLYRVDDVTRFSWPPRYGMLAPLSQWGAGWEETGRQWLTKLPQLKKSDEVSQ